MGVHVPHDVVSNHILPRVPAKSVCRFNCVSKEWHSFLTSKMFKSMHIDHHQNNPKLLLLLKTKTTFEFTTIDCEAPPRRKGLTPARHPLPQFGDTTNPHDIHILTSFHGLVCLGIIKKSHDLGYSYSDLILWNPLTNEYKMLSKSNFHKEFYNIRYSCSGFGLYYSCCEDDYKLLFLDLFENNVYIYSLRSDSWRKIDAFQHTSRLYPGSRSRGTYLNENLYFLQHHSNRRLSSIIRFDTKTERFSLIETQHVDDNPDAYDYFYTIVVISNCIHVCVKYDNYISDDLFGRTACIKLWKLDEYGNMKEVATYQLRSLIYDHTISYLNPFHLMKNGNWLMRNDFSENKIYEVELKKKKHTKDKGKGNEKGNIYDDFEYAEVRVNGNTNNNNNIVDEEVRYIETFVSPNRYMK
ncbi:putative F-box protein [Tanacetum coccineum]